MFHHSNPRLRRGLTFVALAATLGLASLTLSQCRLVDNNVTGPDLSSSGLTAKKVSTCEKKCNDKYKSCVDREDSRYRSALRACDCKPKRQQKSCKESEKKRHDENRKSCQRALTLCKKNCGYREGSGNGGR